MAGQAERTRRDWSRYQKVCLVLFHITLCFYGNVVAQMAFLEAKKGCLSDFSRKNLLKALTNSLI